MRWWHDYLICPGCGRRGVYMKFGARGEDWWRCRYRNQYGCEWTVISKWENSADIAERRRLAELNPGNGIWISDLDEGVM